MEKDSLFIDISHNSLNKKGEELCGDKVEVFKSDDRTIVVLADGLGSSVKANILATITSKIAITMLKKGAELYEVIETIIDTLPVCKVRKIAYSTFSILEIHNDLSCTIFESENPPFFFLRDEEIISPEKEVKEICGKKVSTSKIQLQLNDILYLCSDGVMHAGVGKTLNYGWQWSNVGEYVKMDTTSHALKLSQKLLNVCNRLYDGEPGDDTTVVAIKLREEVNTNLFTGTPVNKRLDEPFVKMFMDFEGKKVVCGGTAAQIVSRVTDHDLETDLTYMDAEIPPTAKMVDIDIVTEGVITMNRVVKMLQLYRDNPNSIDCSKLDGATKLFNLIMFEATSLNIWFGKSINKAHQTPSFPKELSMKINIVNNLKEELEHFGKKVNIQFISEVDYANV